MATIAGRSAPRPQVPAIAGFTERRWSLPVRPGDALQWALLALVLANLGRVPVISTGNRDAAIVLNDVCVAALAAYTIVAALVRRSLILDSTALLALAFAGTGAVSAFASMANYGLTPFELAVSLAYLARWLAYFGVYVFIINNVRVGQVPVVWRSLIGGMLVFAAFGIFQSFFLPDFAQMVYPSAREYIDWDPQGHRLVSTVLDPNIAAAMLLLVLLVLLGQIAAGARMRWWQAGLLLAALTLTLSRSGILSLAVGLGVLLLARGISTRLLKLFGVVLFFSITIIPRLISLAQSYARFDVGEGTSAGTRVLAWLTALEVIWQHPLIGVGFNTYGYVKASMGLGLSGSSSYGSDGGLLFAAVMTGGIGLAIYVMMLAAVIRKCRSIWRSERYDAESRGTAMGVAAGVVAICVHSLFANSLFTTFVMEMMWVSWGMIAVIGRQDA
jgi:hypothetical protein